jgi:primase-polymerase (primpol)-like protein
VIGDGQELIDWLAERMRPETKAAQTNGHATPRTSSGSAHSDDEVIEKCRSAENAPKFEALYDRGDVHAYHGGDDSAADLALLSMLSFYTQDEAQLESIFSSSALGQRAKWRRRDG